VHGGTVLTLPGGKGLVEFQLESGEDTGKSSKSKAVAYFLKADGSGPLDPAPSEVTFTPEGGKSVALKSDGGILKSGRYASDAVLPMAAGRDVAGELSVSLGGDVVKVAVLAR
jgi:hypothetical protein